MRVIFKIKQLLLPLPLSASLFPICFMLLACAPNAEDIVQNQPEKYQPEESQAEKYQPEESQVKKSQPEESQAEKYQLEDYHAQEKILAKPLKQAKEYDPNRLIGLSYGEIYQKLGAPDFARPEGNKEFVQYRDRDCLLDLFIEYWEGVPARDSKNAEIGKQRRQNSSITYAKLRDTYRDAAVPPAILRQCLYLLMERNEK